MRLSLFVSIALTALQGVAQEFTNISFDSPDLTGSLRPVDPSSPRTPFLGQTSQLLRGWTLLGNGLPLGEIGYRPGAGDTIDPVTMSVRSGDGSINYYLNLHSLPLRQVDLSFQQTGRIPLDTVGLTFFANGAMEMIVNGRLLHTVDTSVTTYPTVDLSQYAGQVVSLEFHVFQRPFLGAAFDFDILGFTQIPEPSTWALFGVGAVALGWAVRQRHSP